MMTDVSSDLVGTDSVGSGEPRLRRLGRCWQPRTARVFAALPSFHGLVCDLRSSVSCGFQSPKSKNLIKCLAKCYMVFGLCFSKSFTSKKQTPPYTGWCPLTDQEAWSSPGAALYQGAVL